MTGITLEGDDDAYLISIVEYDASNRPTKTASEDVYFSYNDSKTTLYIDGEHYTFDEYGRLIGFKQEYSSYTNEYVVTFNGNVGKWVKIDEDDEGYYQVTYESNNRLTKLERYEAEESDYYVCEYKYNATGVPIEGKLIEDEGHEERVWSYDANGQLIENKTVTDGNITFRAVYEYHENGRRSKYISISYTDGVETYRTETLFDENGNVI